MLSSREIIKMLKKAGWEHVATQGDHWHFKHPDRIYLFLYMLFNLFLQIPKKFF